MARTRRLVGVVAGLLLGAGAAQAAGPKLVVGPSADPQCYVPWTDQTRYLQYAAKPGPYRVALVNGSVDTAWRIQMLRTARAYAAQPDVKPALKDFKILSTGDDVAAQVAAVGTAIEAGYEAVLVDAQAPAGFKAVVRRAQAAGVVLVFFDNSVDTQDAITVAVDGEELGRSWGDWLAKQLPGGGTILEVRGVAGTGADADRHRGLQAALKASVKPFQTVEVAGRGDDDTTQKVTLDALAAHEHVDGMTAQGGSTGMVRAFMDAGAALVPAAAETENGFRKLCLDHAGEGLRCASVGAGPTQVAVALKVALAALGGAVVPQAIRLPLAHVEDPGFKAGENTYPKQADGFFVDTGVPTCGIALDARDVMGQSDTGR